MRFKTKNPNIYWEDTGRMVVHNYPPDYKTYSYVTRTYRQFEKGKFGYIEVQGDPIYFHDMPYEQAGFAIIMATAQNALQSLCRREKFLKQMDEQ